MLYKYYTRSGVGLGLVRARLATCCFDARALYRFLVLLLLRRDACVCVACTSRVRCPSSPSPTDHLLAIAFVFGSMAVDLARLSTCAVGADGWTWTDGRVIQP